MGQPQQACLGAVGDLVPDQREERGRKVAREVGRGDRAARQLVAALEHVRVRDLLATNANLDAGAVIPNKRMQQFEKVLAEERRLRADAET